MTRIKFSHLTSYLCEGEGSKYFLRSMVMPPLVKQNQSYIFRKAADEDIVKFYRSECQRILEMNGEGVDEGLIKKELFKMCW